jgi:hypothetical protein
LLLGAHQADAQDRLTRSNRFESPQRFAAELRFAFYSPKIDSDPVLGGQKPYANVFGDSARIAVGLEFDWQALRVPYLGTLGLGACVGYTTMSAQAKLVVPRGSQIYSSENTSLDIFPMFGVAVLRADVFPRALGIPFVPYAKVGMGFALWRSYTATGTSMVDGVVAKGMSWGPHMAGGLMLHLNAFDEYTARNLDNMLGINHTYLFIEYYSSDLSGFGKKDMLRVGSNGWAFGLVWEF